MTEQNQNEVKVDWQKKYPYPRRRFIRGLLKAGVALAAGLLTEYKISGKENLPKQGPFLIVGNHFHFIDTIGPIHATKFPFEFIGDMEMPNAPALMKIFPRTWQTLKIEQGTPNFEALRASEAVLAQNGILVIYPEGHTHRPPLGRALPGAAYLAMRSGVPIIPIATYSDNHYDILGSLRDKKRRIKIWTNIGPAFGPFKLASAERPSREEIRESSRIIMSHIANLLPPEMRGEYGELPNPVVS